MVTAFDTHFKPKMLEKSNQIRERNICIACATQDLKN